MAISLQRKEFNSIKNKRGVSYFWHWRRVVSLVVLIAFSNSIISPVFALYDSEPVLQDSKVKAQASFLSPSLRAHAKQSRKLNHHSSASKLLRLMISGPQSRNDKLSRNKYQPYLEIGGAKYFNQKRDVAGIYDLFIPLLQSDNRLFFTDLRIFDRSGGSFEGNAHLGFRKLYPKQKKMWGVYASFDRKRSDYRNWFNQITVGGEFWSGKWFIGGNFYKPIGVTKKSVDPDKQRLARSLVITNYYEQALPGLDMELGYSFTDNLTGYVGGYYFHQKDSSPTTGPKMRLTYNYNQPHGRILGILDGVGIEVGGQYDKPRGSTAYVNIKFKIGLTNLTKNSNLSGFERHMTELVKRDPGIVIGKPKPEFYQTGSQGFRGRGGDDFTKWSQEELLDEMGLPKNATQQEVEKRYQEIRKRYKQESLKHHPDRGGSNEEQREVNSHYEKKQKIYRELKRRYRKASNNCQNNWCSNNSSFSHNKASGSSGQESVKKKQNFQYPVGSKKFSEHVKDFSPNGKELSRKDLSDVNSGGEKFQHNNGSWLSFGGYIFNLIDRGLNKLIGFILPIRPVAATEVDEDLVKAARQQARDWLNKKGELPENLTDDVFNFYEENQSGFADVIVDLLAEDRKLSSKKLEKLVGSLVKIKNPAQALFIALRLTQHQVSMPKEVLRHLIGFLSSEEEAVHSLAIELLECQLNKKIPQDIAIEIIEGLIALLPQVNTNQRFRVLHLIELLEGREGDKQARKLKARNKVLAWSDALTTEEKINISGQLIGKINEETAQELLPFFKGHLKTQNYKLLEIAKSAFAILGKYQELAWTESEKDILTLFDYANSWWIKRLWKRYVAREFFELQVGNAIFLFTPLQWRNAKKIFKKYPWLRRYLKYIEFAEFKGLNKFLLFIEESGVNKDEVRKALDRYAWNINSNILCQELFKNLVVNMEEFLGSQLEKQNALSEYGILKEKVEYLKTELKWPVEFLCSLLGRANQGNVLELITILEVIADYQLFPEAINRYGENFRSVLRQRSVDQWLQKLLDLLRDYRFFVSKSRDALFKEIKEADYQSSNIIELVDSGYLDGQLNKIAKIKDDWLGYNYAIRVIAGRDNGEAIQQGKLYVYRDVRIGRGIEENNCVLSENCHCESCIGEAIKESSKNIEHITAVKIEQPKEIKQICFATKEKNGCLDEGEISQEILEKLNIFLDDQYLSHEAVANQDKVFVYEQAARLGMVPKLKGIIKLLAKWQKKDFIKWRKTIAAIDDDNIAEVVAVLSQAVRNTIFIKQKAYPRVVQMISLLSLLKSPTGVLAQIATGEGKTLTIAMFAAIKALEGRGVDIITSSSKLAKRDVVDYKKFYSYLDISVGNNIDVDFNAKSLAKSCYKKDVVYGDILSFSGDALRDLTDNIRYSRGFDVLIVDEVDSMFIDKNNMKVQLSKPIPGFEVLGQLLVYMWGVAKNIRAMLYEDKGQCYYKMPASPEQQEEFLRDKNPGVKYVKEGENIFNLTAFNEAVSCSSIVDTNIVNYTKTDLFAFHHLDRQKRLFVVPPDKEQFVKDQLPNWVRSLSLAQLVYQRGVHYIIDKNPYAKGLQDAWSDELVPIDIDSGEIQYNLRLSDGLHQFLEIANSLMFRSETVTSTFMSYYRYFNKYRGRLYGLTGTMGKKAHRNFLEKNYLVDTFTIPTFAYKDLIRFKEKLCHSDREWSEEIISDIYRRVVRRKRAVLVLMETVREVESLYNYLVRQNVEGMLVFTYGTGVNNSSEFNVKNKLLSGMVVIATNLAGRGTDLAISREVLRNGGLHVIPTRLSKSVRVSDQGEGRASRKGEPGTVQPIINVEHLPVKNKTVQGLNEYQEEQEVLWLKNIDEVGMPHLGVFDRLFDAYEELVKNFDTPTGYSLSIGRPENLEEIKPFSFYLYQQGQKIKLEVIRDRGKESIFLDITELILAVDSDVKKYLGIFLVNPGSGAVASFSKQAYEAIHFIAANQGYTRDKKFYGRVKAEFTKNCKVILGWSFHEYDEATRKTQCLRRLLWSDREEQIRGLRKYSNKHGIDDVLLARVGSRKLFLIWLEQRKKYNKKYELQQLEESWGFWLRKHVESLNRYAFQQINKKDKSLVQIEEDLFKDFNIFRQEILSKKDQKDFITNPAYLVNKAWYYLNIDQSKAYEAIDIAVKQDQKTHSWQACGAKANIGMVVNGGGIHWADKEGMGRAYEIKKAYGRDAGASVEILKIRTVPGIENTLVVLSFNEVASYNSEAYVCRIVEIETYNKILDLKQKNLELLGNTTSKEKIEVDYVVNLEEAIKKINITAKILEDQEKRGKLTTAGVKFLENNPGKIDKLGSSCRKKVLRQIASSGGVVVKIKAVEMPEPPKDWLGTIVSAVMGAVFICAGVLFSALTGGVGGVFWGVLSKSFVAKGIGDIISSGLSVIRGQPIELKSYLKSSTISVGVAIITAGVLQFIDNVAGQLQMFDGIAGRAKDIHGATIDNPIKNNPLGYIGKSFGYQGGVTVASALLYEGARKTVDIDELKNKASRESEVFVEKPYRGYLQNIFITDEYNEDNRLSDSLYNKIIDINNNYLTDKFEDTGTKLGVGSTTNVAAQILDGALPSFPSMWSSMGIALQTGVDAMFGAMKKKNAIPDIFYDIKKSIRELSRKTLKSGEVFEKEVLKHGNDGLKLMAAVKEQGYLNNYEINYQNCGALGKLNLEGIEFEHNTGDYRVGLQEVCGNVRELFTRSYEGKFTQFKNNVIDSTTSTTYIISKNTVEAVTQGVGQGVVSMFSQSIQKDIERELKRGEQAEIQVVIDDPELQKQKKARHSELGDLLLDDFNRNLEQAKVSQNKPQIKDGKIMIKVEKGMTLSELAKTHDTTVEELAGINNIKDPNRIYAGQSLIVPLRGGSSGSCFVPASKSTSMLDDIWNNGLKKHLNKEGCYGNICSVSVDPIGNPSDFLKDLDKGSKYSQFNGNSYVGGNLYQELKNLAKDQYGYKNPPNIEKILSMQDKLESSLLKEKNVYVKVDANTPINADDLVYEVYRPLNAIDLEGEAYVPGLLPHVGFLENDNVFSYSTDSVVKKAYVPGIKSVDDSSIRDKSDPKSVYKLFEVGGYKVGYEPELFAKAKEIAEPLWYNPGGKDKNKPIYRIVGHNCLNYNSYVAKEYQKLGGVIYFVPKEMGPISINREARS